MVFNKNAGLSEADALAKEPVDYADLLMLQLKGLAALTTSSSPDFIIQYRAAIGLLCTMLLPFHDALFKQTAATVAANESRYIEQQGHSLKAVDLLQYADQRLENAILLMHRKNLLTRMTVSEEVDPDDELTQAEPASEAMV